MSQSLILEESVVKLTRFGRWFGFGRLKYFFVKSPVVFRRPVMATVEYGPTPRMDATVRGRHLQRQFMSQTI